MNRTSLRFITPIAPSSQEFNNHQAKVESQIFVSILFILIRQRFIYEVEYNCRCFYCFLNEGSMKV